MDQDNGIRALAKKQQDITNEMRLRNWGNWCRSGSHPGLGYSTWGQILKQFLGERSRRTMIDELDAQILEETISSLDIAGRNGFGWGQLYSFCLRVEYVERHDSMQRPQSERAKDVSRKFQRPCAARTYRQHLYNARRAVFALIEPI